VSLLLIDLLSKISVLRMGICRIDVMVSSADYTT